MDYLEKLALGLGRLMLEAPVIMPTREAIVSWKHKLEKLVLDSDQLDLHATLKASNESAPAFKSEAYVPYVEHYTDAIECMRQQLYQWKAINRAAYVKKTEDRVGDYRIVRGGPIFFHDKEIAFGGKLKALLIRLIVNNDHTISAKEVAEVWGDGNLAKATRHINDLNNALKGYYGDGRMHISRIATSPVVYSLDIKYPQKSPK